MVAICEEQRTGQSYSLKGFERGNSHGKNGFIGGGIGLEGGQIH